MIGNYAPHTPHTLGQEWVPIRNEDLFFSPAVDVTEVGHSFTTTASRVIQDGRFYINTPAPGFVNGQTTMISIYPAGMEAETGPIRSVTIPVSNGGVTGTNITLGGSSMAAALADPSDGQKVSATFSGGLQMFSLFFATNSYPVLSGKRILAVNLVYVAEGDFDVFAETPSVPATNAYLDNDADQRVFFGTLTGLDSIYITQYARLRYGEMNHFWSTALGPNGTSDRMPWRYADLQRFEASAANRLFAYFILQLPANTNFTMRYAALEVVYCEEQRIIYGGKSYTGNYAVGPSANIITLRDTSQNPTPTLAIGTYTTVISSADPGDLNDGIAANATYPKSNSLRELYRLPTIPGVEVTLPFPPEAHHGETFTAQETHILPQLTIHTSGGPLPEVHVYGRQAKAQVYGTITATQEIDDAPAGGARNWPWVRFYARRFGNTSSPLLLDSPTIAGSSVSITPASFDALDEIIDGWKEVTLRFVTAPSMGTGTNPQWRWSATGENAGNRWEVLGVQAPAVSAIPGNFLNLIPAPQQLSSATYGEPSNGANINLGWLAPTVTVTTDDPTADAVIIFAQDMPTVTGFTVVGASQAVTGIGLDCGGVPCCVPSAILYNRLTWSPPAGSAVLLDTFTRGVTGWGTSDNGKVYTDTGGTVEGNYIVNGSTGTQVLDGVANVVRASTVAGAITDSHQRTLVSVNVAPAGASMRGGIIGHYVDANNYDFVDLRWSTVGNAELVISTLVAGVSTGLTNVSAGEFLAGQAWWLDVDFNGGSIRAKAWPDGSPEPVDYMVSLASTFTTGGYGLRSIRSTGNTNTTAVMSFDNYTVGPSTWAFGFYELQRMDALGDWQTIMKNTAASATSFLDYESRVGILTSYRIRSVDLYGFYGLWSSTVTITMARPGLVAGCATGGHVLIFTTNEIQSGRSNLGYSSAWENGQVVEDFTFPEASFNQLQTMYNKDFFTAFRPTERGGVQFTRTVLVQAAAIAPETLADFTDLRSMAWNKVPYICVRDEDGNRWFANVTVPSGRVIANRSIYLAPVNITKVTDIPSPVNPGV